VVPEGQPQRIDSGRSDARARLSSRSYSRLQPEGQAHSTMPASRLSGILTAESRGRISGTDGGAGGAVRESAGGSAGRISRTDGGAGDAVREPSHLGLSALLAAESRGAESRGAESLVPPTRPDQQGSEGAGGSAGRISGADDDGAGACAVREPSQRGDIVDDLRVGDPTTRS
jgi:hypothetical protein